MANYEAVARTNYFQVTDIPAFERWMEEYNHAGTMLKNEGFVGFYYGNDTTFLDENNNDVTDEAIERLQNLLPENEACIIMEVGHEKHRYLYVGSTIITKTDVEVVTLEPIVLGKIRQMLNDPDYDTRMFY